MQYGFVIDQDACIGCHACTVACKAENDVPVGNFRTNVKYVEIGQYPNFKRNFLVQRCNHCTDAPCVAICPVNALKKRDDGIVDIDRDACFGCRACMQACPYDAIYLNEDKNAVEKCHFCAHKVEKGLEPACVTVCPVGAIIPGDFDDPESKVSLLKRAKDMKARRPEQGTGPNVFYVGANDVALQPGKAEKPAKDYIWSQRRQIRTESWPKDVPPEPHAREALNAEHKVEWGWPVALYLLTKGIAAGAAMIAPFFALFNTSVPWWGPESVAMLFLLITSFLLIEDLKKPQHFYRMFTRPNWNSWLVKGGIVLNVFGGLTTLILLLGFLGTRSGGAFEGKVLGAIGGAGYEEIIQALRWANAGAGIMLAGYTAFLFKQCKGRDLWEADGLFAHLIAQSVTAAAAFFLLFGLGGMVSVGALIIGVLVLMVLHTIPTKEKDRTDNYMQAKGFMQEMTFAGINISCGTKKIMTIAAGVVLLLSFTMGTKLALLISIPAAVILFALYLYEKAFVRAGQLPPLS